MIEFSPHIVLIAALAFFLAGLVKGVTGMGLPPVAMGVLGIVMPPVAAAALLLAPAFVTNVWQLFAGPSFAALAKRLWTMLLAIVAGTFAGSWLLVNDTKGLTIVALGAALTLYAAVGLMNWTMSVPPRLEARLSPLMGLATGLLTGGTGVSSMPTAPYLQALGLDRDDLVQALGLAFTVATIALGVALASGGALALDGLGASLLAIAPAFAGMWAGQHVRRRISAETFRRWFLIILLLLGLQLMAQPLFSR